MLIVILCISIIFNWNIFSFVVYQKKFKNTMIFRPKILDKFLKCLYVESTNQHFLLIFLLGTDWHVGVFVCIYICAHTYIRTYVHTYWHIYWHIYGHTNLSSNINILHFEDSMQQGFLSMSTQCTKIYYAHAPAGNRTRGPTMATLDFTTKPLARRCHVFKQHKSVISTQQPTFNY